MNKFITLILCLCCVFTSAWAEGDDHTSLNPSDANIVGHILDKKQESISLLSMSTSTYDDRYDHRRYRSLLYEESSRGKIHLGHEVYRI